MENSKILITAKDIQHILNIGRSQAYKLMKSDSFKTKRINNSIYAYSESFFDWLYDGLRNDTNAQI